MEDETAGPCYASAMFMGKLSLVSWLQSCPLLLSGTKSVQRHWTFIQIKDYDRRWNILPFEKRYIWEKFILNWSLMLIKSMCLYDWHLYVRASGPGDLFWRYPFPSFEWFFCLAYPCSSTASVLCTLPPFCSVTCLPFSHLYRCPVPCLFLLLTLLQMPPVFLLFAHLHSTLTPLSLWPLP